MDRSSNPAEVTTHGVRTHADAVDLCSCAVELHADGSVVLVVDGERLFRFDSFDALLAQYQLVRGDSSARDSADAELAAAEISVQLVMAGLDGPARSSRAHKVLVDDRVAAAIERVRLAREHLRTVR